MDTYVIFGFNTDTAYDHYRLNWYKIMSTSLLGNPPVCSIEASISTESRGFKMGVIATAWKLIFLRMLLMNDSWSALYLTSV